MLIGTGNASTYVGAYSILARLDDWIVQALVAAGTLGAVYAALFGDSFKAKRVRLSGSIENPRGVYTPTSEPAQYTTTSGTPVYMGYQEGEARFYQLRLRCSLVMRGMSPAVCRRSYRIVPAAVDIAATRERGDTCPMLTYWALLMVIVNPHEIPGPRLDMQVLRVFTSPEACTHMQIEFAKKNNGPLSNGQEMYFHCVVVQPPQ